MIKSVLIFGGTFDPVHLGHKIFLQGAHSLVMPDLTLIIPTKIPPHKPKAFSSEEARIQMCQTLCKAINNAQVFLFEMQKDGKSYTIDTINKVQSENENAMLYLCVGSDMLLYFRKWHKWEEIIKKVIIVVQERQSADVQKTKNEADILIEKGAKILFCGVKPFEVSSTMLREKNAAGEDISKFVSPQVKAIIDKNRLYI